MNAIETNDWEPICKVITENPLYWQGLIAIAILLCALVLLSRMRRWRQGVQLTDSDSGEVRISSAALDDLITSACNQIDTVRKPRIRFRTAGGRLHLHAKVQLSAGRRITDVYEEMKRELTSVLEATLGFERIGTINVTVTGFEKSRRKTTPLYSSAETNRTVEETAVDEQDGDSEFEADDLDGADDSQDKRDDPIR